MRTSLNDVGSANRPAARSAARVVRPVCTSRKADNEVAQHLLLLAQTTRHGVLITDGQGVVTWSNGAVCALTGHGDGDGEVVGQPLCRLLRDHQRERDNLVYLRAAMAQGAACCTTLLTHAGDGGEHWLNVDLQPVPDADGGVRSFAVVLTDISEQVWSRRNLEAVIDSAAAGIVLRDHGGRIVDCNPEARRLLGITRDPVTGGQWRESDLSMIREDGCPFPPDEGPAAQVLASGDPVRGMIQGLALPSGDRRWLLVNSQLLSDDSARQRHTVTSYTDVTADKSMQAELGAERQRLAATLEGTGAGTWEWNVLTGATRFDELWAQIIGHTRAELEPASVLTMIERMHPDDRAASERAMRAHFVGEVDNYNMELRVRHQSGHWIWVRTRGRVASWLPDGRAWMMFGTTVDITARKELEQQLRTAARSDRLTGFPNRDWMIEEIERAVAGAEHGPAQPFAVLFLDFDRFKLVNDTMGHEAGDVLLRKIAGRLRAALPVNAKVETGRKHDFVARYGGDEFVVLLHDITDPAQALAIANRLITAAAPPHLIRDKEVHSTVSIGIALGRPGCDTADELLRNADMAMYEAKRLGRARAVFYDESMHTRAARAMKVEQSLRHAIEAGQMSVVYQPIVSLETGRMTSAEALLRWHEPDLGIVSPAEFIPIAEDTGLIIPIGEWVLRQACSQWDTWRRDQPALAPASISVNLSRVQMNLGEQLPALVRQVLDQCGMQANELQLEVTEREVMRNPEQSRALMHKLHDMGVKLAMDDFGTGTSSLGCLREFPFDVIKIDKSFVDELASSTGGLAVIHATVNVVRNLGMASVAEGIEGQDQVGILQSLGCDYGQGYYFSRPVPGDKLLEAMATVRAARPAGQIEPAVVR